MKGDPSVHAEAKTAEDGYVVQIWAMHIVPYSNVPCQCDIPPLGIVECNPRLGTHNDMNKIIDMLDHAGLERCQRRICLENEVPLNVNPEFAVTGSPNYPGLTRHRGISASGVNKHPYSTEQDNGIYK